MPKYVAFLRAINVGGHVVKMDQLRRLFEEMKFANVETFIASGNVIFDSRAAATALESKIEKYLNQQLGYEVKTFLRTVPELAAIAAHKPFSDAELNATGHILYVGFLGKAPGQSQIEVVMSLAGRVDSFQVSQRELYWLCRKSFSESEVSGALLEKKLGMAATLRNINTVRRIVAKYS
jgi:uncharacterized protein (DUF1697 family)